MNVRVWARQATRCSGPGAILFPSPQEARTHKWTESEKVLVQDRVDTRFVGSPDTVVARLEQLRGATDADELATTITHQHADRLNSYDLLAKAWLS